MRRVVSLGKKLFDVLMAEQDCEVNKLYSVEALLQVWGGMMGISKKDFAIIMEEVVESYCGPFPDYMVDEIYDHYEGQE